MINLHTNAKCGNLPPDTVAIPIVIREVLTMPTKPNSLVAQQFGLASFAELLFETSDAIGETDGSFETFH